MNKIKELAKREQELSKKITLLEELHRIFVYRGSKKKMSEYDNMLVLFMETVWLARVKKDMPEMIGEFKNFGGLDLLSVVVKDEEKQYEQLTLPGMQTFLSRSSGKKQKLSAEMFLGRNCFIKHQGAVHMAEMLALHDKKTLEDFSRYLVKSVPARAKQKELAEQLSAYICEHPLHLLPSLSLAAVSRLFCFAELEEESEVIIDENTVNEYISLMSWGLISVEIIRKDGNLYFALDVPEEVKQNVIPVF